jgi:signal transduction histidine kinase
LLDDATTASSEILHDELLTFLEQRVSIRFLMHQLLQSCQGFASEPCDPVQVAMDASEQATDICRQALGRAPEIVVKEEHAGLLNYWTTSLRYVLLEVLKNACRATVEHHSGQQTLPPVTLCVRGSSERVIVEISDQGGGISAQGLESVWDLCYTTASTSSAMDAMVDGFQPSAAKLISLRGRGVGLPLSRLQVRYFGGDMQLESVEGQGTLVRIELERCSGRREVLASNLASKASAATDHQECLFGAFVNQPAVSVSMTL